MKLVRWKRFNWELKALPALEPKISSAYTIRPATVEDEKAVQSVIFTAFSLDSTWGDSFKLVRSFIEAQLSTSFLNRDDISCLVVTHGVRIIAASALNISDNAASNLISGPCVLSEYSSRGLGTALLYASLVHLKASGLERASGIARDSVTAARFLYPKFGSTVKELDHEAWMEMA